MRNVSWAPGLLLAVGGVLALPAAVTAAGQAPTVAPTTASAGDDVGELRRELESLRQDYASRVAALEARLLALEGSQAQAPAP